jgi:serine protease
VAATIGEQTNNTIGVTGIAFNVKLMPPSAWEMALNPIQPRGSAATIAAAVRYAADHGAKVIDLSPGGFAPCRRSQTRSSMRSITVRLWR